MSVSMTLIAEHIKWDGCLISVHEAVQRQYQDIMFYSSSAFLEPFSDYIYITGKFPADLSRIKQDMGLIYVVPVNEFTDAADRVSQLVCNYLLLGTNLSFWDVFNEIHADINFLQRQTDIFKMAVYTQQSLQKLIEMIFDIMGNPAYLVDSSFKVLAIDRSHDMRELSAAWRRLEDDGYLPFDLVNSLIQSKELSDMEGEEGAAIIHSRYFYVPFINYNLKQYGKVKGHLFIVGMKKSFCKSDIELAECLGGYVLESMLRSSAFQNERGDYYEHFMKDLFSGKLADPVRICQQMLPLEMYPEDYFTVVVLYASSEHGWSDERIASQVERCSGAKPVFYKDKIVALFTHGKSPDAGRLNSELTRISQSLQCAIGISDTFQGFYDLNTYYIQAEWALTCVSSDEDKTSQPLIRYYRDYMIQHLIFGFSQNEKWETLLEPGLRRLKQYDLDTHNELMKTLYVYLEHERNVMETSRLLHIHRSTLSYRLNKIVELCGFELDKPVLRHRLFLGMEVLKMFE